ncbi:MAG: hypothetical protein SCM11_03425 [Bacillota bacterium]|nr:hypothetical protein [Bacillota bacterium]
MSESTYRNIGKKTWNEILMEDAFLHQPSLTVHLPVQPAHSPDFVQIDCALNASVRRVLPGLTSEKPSDRQAAAGVEVMVVEFALDDPGFVPDCKLTRMSLAEDGCPIARADYFALDIHYKMDYFCKQISSSQSALWIRCMITNEGESSRRGHVRVKVNFQAESAIFDYHYVPFYWDNTKWPDCQGVSLDADLIKRDGEPIGQVWQDGCTCEWEPVVTFDPSQYNQRFGCSTPYFVMPAQRLKTVSDVIHFYADLEEGESAAFCLGLLTRYDEIDQTDWQTFTGLTPETALESARHDFQALLPDNPAQLVCKQNNLEHIFRQLQFSTLQLLVRFPGRTDLVPTQGGSSERHYVWVWEAVEMLSPMLKLGYRKPVLEAIDSIFSLQDGGYPPKGEFSSLKGAVGTTGPRWANSTGSALWLAASYFLFSKDRDFLEKYLSKIIRAADWIVGEIRATRKLLPDGTRPLYYGLMPYATATDGDVGYNVAFTDAYTYIGLESAANMLVEAQHERAGVYRKECDRYRADISLAIQGLAKPDGDIDRQIHIKGVPEVFCRKFQNITGAIHLLRCGALDPEGEICRRFIDYYEKHRTQDYFWGYMDREVRYMGVGEFIWQDLYLRRGAWKKAFAALRTNLNYGMTRDTLQVQERFSILNPAFTPWQPNGSGNGRMLDMIVKSFYFEHQDGAVLLGCVPFAWLEGNKTTALRHLRTPEGEVSIEITADGEASYRVCLSGAFPRRLRFPGHFAARAKTSGVIETTGGYFSVDAALTEIVFEIKNGEVQSVCNTHDR